MAARKRKHPRGYATYRAKVMALAKQLGATVSGMENGEVNVEAPQGHVWSTGENIHELVNSPFGEESMADLYEEAYRRMSLGVEVCPIENCEWCAIRPVGVPEQLNARVPKLGED